MVESSMGCEEIVGLVIGIKENQTRNNVRPFPVARFDVNTSGSRLDTRLAVRWGERRGVSPTRLHIF
jgi:hypothetical protein